VIWMLAMAESEAHSALDERVYDVSSHFLRACDCAQMMRIPASLRRPMNRATN
jgi:hypothetical protein